MDQYNLLNVVHREIQQEAQEIAFLLEHLHPHSDTGISYAFKHKNKVSSEYSEKES